MHRWCLGWWLLLGQAGRNGELGNGKEDQQWSYLYQQDRLEGHVCYIVPHNSKACVQEPSLQATWWSLSSMCLTTAWIVVTMHQDLLTWPLVTPIIYSWGYGKQLLPDDVQAWIQFLDQYAPQPRVPDASVNRDMEREVDQLVFRMCDVPFQVRRKASQQSTSKYASEHNCMWCCIRDTVQSSLMRRQRKIPLQEPPCMPRTAYQLRKIVDALCNCSSFWGTVLTRDLVYILAKCQQSYGWCQ